MATGDRNKSGKATDGVFHYSSHPGYPPLCGTKNWTVTTNGEERHGPVTCKKCLKKLKQTKP